MSYGIMHIQYGGRHIAAKGGQATGRNNGVLFDLIDNLTGELLLTGTSAEVSESNFISVDQRNIASYAKRKMIASGNIRIEYHTEENDV